MSKYLRRSFRDLIIESGMRRGSFTLSSGLSTNVLFDLRPILLDTTGLSWVVNEIDDLFNRSWLKFITRKNSRLSGIAAPDGNALLILGGLRLSERVFYVPTIPYFYVRPAPKDHGSLSIVEGLPTVVGLNSMEGQNILLIDDVVTTGGTLISTANTLRNHGARVENAWCVIERTDLTDARELLKGNDIELHSVYTSKDFGI